MTNKTEQKIEIPGFQLAFDNSDEGTSRVKVAFANNTETNTTMVEALRGYTTDIQDLVAGRHISLDGPCSLPLAMLFTRIVAATAPSLKVNAPREGAYVEVYKTND